MAEIISEHMKELATLLKDDIFSDDKNNICSVLLKIISDSEEYSILLESSIRGAQAIYSYVKVPLLIMQNSLKPYLSVLLVLVRTEYSITASVWFFQLL